MTKPITTIPLTDLELKAFDTEIAPNLELCRSAGPDWSVLLLRMRATITTAQARIAGLEAGRHADRVALQDIRNCAHGIMPFYSDREQLKSIIIRLDDARWTRLAAILWAAEDAILAIDAEAAAREIEP